MSQAPSEPRAATATPPPRAYWLIPLVVGSYTLFFMP
jgi:hypothetical protein